MEALRLFRNRNTVCTLANKGICTHPTSARALPGIHSHRYMYTTDSS